MKLRDIMTEDVETIRPEASVQEAAQKMAELDIGSIPVMDGDHLVGIVTDRDITIKATALGLSPDEVPVRDVMSSPVIFGDEGLTADEAADLMETHQIRRLPVMSSDRHLVGIVTLGDLATRVPEEGVSTRALEGVSEQGLRTRNVH